LPVESHGAAVLSIELNPQRQGQQPYRAVDDAWMKDEDRGIERLFGVLLARSGAEEDGEGPAAGKHSAISLWR